MSINVDAQQLAAFECRLGSGECLSESELDTMIAAVEGIWRRRAPVFLRGKFVAEVADEVEAAAGRVLGLALEAKEALVERDVALLPLLCALDLRVAGLWLRRGLATGDEFRGEMGAVVGAYEALEEAHPGSDYVLERVREVKARIEDLVFSFHFPVVGDLKAFGRGVRQC